MKSSSAIRFASLLVLIATASFCIAQTYTLTDLGFPSGDGYFSPRGINAAAQVGGSAGSNNANNSGVTIYSNGNFTNLGSLGGDDGIANGINASGVVAGYSTNAAGTYRAFISSGSTLVDLGDLGGGSATAYAINDSGQVVGSAVTANGSNHPFLYSQGKITDLGTLGSPEGGMWWNTALGINNAGVVVGYSYTSNNNDPFLAFAWHNGKMIPLGSLGGGMSQAYAINNHNQITGIAYLKNGLAHAFLIGPSQKMKDLGTLQPLGYTRGIAINDSGVVVGEAQLNSGATHAFIYNGKMQDLNALIPKGSGLLLIEADGINNTGQIVCTAQDSSGNLHAVLLTPQ